MAITHDDAANGQAEIGYGASFPVGSGQCLIFSAQDRVVLATPGYATEVSR